VKISAFMLVAGAAVAFAAPIANASHQRAVPHNKTSVHGKTHQQVKTKTGSSIKVSPRPPLYIFVPGFSGGPVSSPDATQLCLEAIDNCTDQQLCDNWGLNCSTAGGQTPVVETAPAANTSEPVVSSLVEAVVSDAAPVAASAASTSAMDDPNDC
jgi:hypothetical protein